MNKSEFLARIRAELQGMPAHDLEQALAYYSEMIDEHLEEGLSEQEAVSALGPAEEAVEQILAEMPLPKLVRARIRPGRSYRVWEILLLILGSPVWLPLLVTALAILLVVYLLIWVVVCCLYAADAALAAGAVGGLTGAAILAVGGTFVQAGVLLGAGLICTGAAIAAFLGCNLAAKSVGRGSRRLALWIKARLARKEQRV